eukprot:TRINITY_DN3459_c0_g1_i1.p1 TRINITY_DN3459_c0_g1~~TRINITY_DN3459_c0_g1_i1.p1  ORF type:complete len:397 (+),score=106.85 TRINITY_DN3459_c0_g1_i1:133-1323(+)
MGNRQSKRGDSRKIIQTDESDRSSNEREDHEQSGDALITRQPVPEEQKNTEMQDDPTTLDDSSGHQRNIISPTQDPSHTDHLTKDPSSTTATLNPTSQLPPKKIEIRSIDLDGSFRLPHLGIVPLDMWRVIFSFLDPINIAFASWTCRKFYQATTELRKMTSAAPSMSMMSGDYSGSPASELEEVQLRGGRRIEGDVLEYLDGRTSRVGMPNQWSCYSHEIELLNILEPDGGSMVVTSFTIQSVSPGERPRWMQIDGRSIRIPIASSSTMECFAIAENILFKIYQEAKIKYLIFYSNLSSSYEVHLSASPIIQIGPCLYQFDSDSYTLSSMTNGYLSIERHPFSTSTTSGNAISCIASDDRVFIFGHESGFRTVTVFDSKTSSLYRYFQLEFNLKE